ncbi:hypothetical protein PR048_025684 [Dryococelus australis]|uniref:Major facilitator superfamily (MFS) profile domain-containing protein n=1 Tax=Dryococelus australis TaxID=614101 RepID=A0ABQ9GJ83_9NEOP|nr:hypothetical protein PR048_025684 [Dryococelus australis]
MSDEEDTSTLLWDKLDERKVMDLSKPQSLVVKVDHSVTAVNTRNDVLLTALVAGFSGFCFGFEIGLSAHIMAHVKHIFLLGCSEEHVHTIVWFIGTLLSSLLGGMVIDSCGRRCSIIFSTVLMVFGLVLTGITPSYPVFLCGRLLSGVGSALSAVTQCVYAAEMAQDSHRGRLVTGHQLGAAAGFLACSTGLLWSSLPWQAVLWMPIIPALVQAFVVATSLPESPHYRLLQMSQSVQTRSLCCVLGSILEVFVLALGLVFFQQFTGRFTILDYMQRLLVTFGVFPGDIGTITSIALGLVKLHQVPDKAVVLVSETLRKRVPTRTQSTVRRNTFSTVAQRFACQVCAVCVSLSVIDRLGRRPVLMLGATCMMLSLATMTLLSTFTGDASSEQEEELSFAAGIPLAAPERPTGAPPPFPMLPTPLSLVVGSQCDKLPLPLQLSLGAQYTALFLLLCYEVSYFFSWWPAVWLLLVELFPAAVRGRAVAAALTLYWLAHVFVPVASSHLTMELYSVPLIVLVRPAEEQLPTGVALDKCSRCWMKLRKGMSVYSSVRSEDSIPTTVLPQCNITKYSYGSLPVTLEGNEKSETLSCVWCMSLRLVNVICGYSLTNLLGCGVELGQLGPAVAWVVLVYEVPYGEVRYSLAPGDCCTASTKQVGSTQPRVTSSDGQTEHVLMGFSTKCGGLLVHTHLAVTNSSLRVPCLSPKGMEAVLTLNVLPIGTSR